VGELGWPELGRVAEKSLIFSSVCDKRTSGLVFCAQRFFLWGEFSFTFARLSAKVIHTPQRGCTVNAWRRSPIL
jgi:hypothetical protein